MKRLIRAAMPLALGCSYLALGQTALTPKLILSQESWDFGEVWHPESPTLTLIVKNAGDADLVLNDVRASCGCTLVEAGRKQIPPGETADIHIRYNTEGKQDHVTSSVKFETNDPARSKVEFRISGTVKRAVRREPLAGLVIRTLDPNPGQTATVQLINQTEQPMKLQLISCTVPGLEVELRELTEGRISEAIGRTTKVMRHGVTRGELVFATGLQQEERLTVTALVQVMTLVDPVPLALYLDPKTAAAPGTRSINLNYYGTMDNFRVTGATCRQAPGMIITIGSLEPAPSGLANMTPKMKYVVKTELSVPSARDLPPGGWVIEYTTNDPAFPNLQVPVTNERRVWEELVNGPREVKPTPSP